MTRHLLNKARGFLVLEILIAGLILTSGIAATMYLFRMGFEHLERAEASNTLSEKLILTSGLLRTLDLDKKKGTQDMGDGVRLQWEASLLASVVPLPSDTAKVSASRYELFLYRIKFYLSFRGVVREYQVNDFRYRSRYPQTNAPV